MTTIQKRKILKRIVDIEQQISDLKNVRNELCTNGYQSASMSSGSGSRSYTKMDVQKISDTISELTTELKSLRALLSGQSSLLPSQITTIYL